MNFRSKGNFAPFDRRMGIERVDLKYFSRAVSRTAIFVDRARPDEKAILASVVSTLDLNH
jgi:hypothetical protein